MITIAVEPLITMFLIAIRLGTVLLLSPIEAIRQLPIHARLLLVLILSGLIAANATFPTVNTSHLSLIVSGLSECGNGLILSLSLYAAFAVFQMAGQLIDTQMGLNAMAILNPTDHSHEPLSGRLLVMLALLFFFALDGHHQLIQALSLSFHLITPGQLILFNGFLPIVHQCSLMFSMALLLASPVVVSLMIIDLAGAILTRNMPQISTYFLTLPIKIMLGLLMFSLLINDINPFMQKVFHAYFDTLSRVIS